MASSYSLKRLHQFLSDQYARDDIGRTGSLPLPLPAGMEAVSDKQVGTTSTTEVLTLKVRDLTVAIDPAAATVTWTSNSYTLVGDVTGLSGWEVLETDPQRVFVRLIGTSGGRVSAFAIGIVRFEGVTIALRDAPTTAVNKTTAWPHRIELPSPATAGWHVASATRLSLPTSGVPTTEDKRWAIYRSTDGSERFLASLAGGLDEDLIIAEETNSKLILAFRQGYWAWRARELDVELPRERSVWTATGGFLDRHARALSGKIRRSGETDASLRLRVAAELQAKITRSTYGGVLALVAGLLGTDEENVSIVNEAVDPADGQYEGARFNVSFSFDLLASLGIEPEDYTDTIDEINKLLLRISGGGVYAEVLPIGGAVWDTDTYDDPDAVYGA